MIWQLIFLSKTSQISKTEASTKCHMIIHIKKDRVQTIWTSMMSHRSIYLLELD